MFTKLPIVILAIVLFTSCSERRMEDVTDPFATIDIAGVSVLPLRGNNWKIISKSGTNVIFARKGSQPDATYTATVIQVKLPETESKEQFAREMRQKLQSENENERFKLIKNEGNIAPHQETLCWRYHMIAEDRAARTKSGKKAMLLELIGQICRHPKSKNVGINIQYSHRYHSGNQDPFIAIKADQFFNRVTFADIRSKSDDLHADDEAQRNYMRGLSYLKEGCFDNAIPALNRAIESDPQFALAYNDRGYAYLHKQRYDLAIDDFSMAIKLSKHPHAYHNRGIAYRHKGEYDDAISDQTNALKLNPMEAGIYYERGLSYLENGQKNKAIDDFDQAISLDPKRDSFYEARGRAYSFSGDFKKAISDFTTAIGLNPSNDIAYYMRGVAYLNRKNEPDKAIADFTISIELYPEQAAKYFYRGIAYAKRSLHQKTIADLTQAIEIQPEYPGAHFRRGTVYRLIGQYDKAISDFNRAIDLNQKSPGAYNAKAWLLSTCPEENYRDGEIAVPLAKKAVTLNRHPFYLDTLAAAYAESGAFDDALRTQEDAITLLIKGGGSKSSIDRLTERLNFYKENKPWRD